MAVNGIAERIATEEYRPRPVPVEKTSPPRNPEEPTPQTKKQTDFISHIAAAFTAIALILSVRLLLLLSIIGAFYLGYIAMQNQNTYTLWVLGIFCAFTVPILSYLDIHTRRR